MTIEEAKKIGIADYLHSLGIEPNKQQGNSLWYLSPLRTESEPSFKVNQSRNEWYDFGLGTGGDILKLAMELHATDSISYALAAIADKIPHPSPNSFSFRPQEVFERFEDITVKPLANVALLQFLAERQIPAAMAQPLCQEVYYKLSGKPYFAIGFGNESGGYELRNKYFKGCLSPKSITITGNGKPSCCVFEGFMDYLSYLTLKLRYNIPQSQLKERDYIVLNSIVNVPKVLDRLEQYEQVFCFLDNDLSGINALDEIQKRCGYRMSDQSVHYREYKDLNDYLCGRKIENNQVSNLKKEQPKPIPKPVRRMKL